MKKERNCGATPYPVYPPYQGMGMIPPYGMTNNMQPMIPINMMGTYANQGNFSTNTIEQQLNSMEQQINSLENRISNLENIVNNSNAISSNKYNSSNYQMM